MKHYLNWEEGTLHGYLSSALKPALVIESGDRVVFRTLEADWRVGDRFITASDEGGFFPGRKALDRGHALCGPVYIRGADAGTTLEITIRRIRCGSWGWSRFGGGDGDHLRQMAFQGAEYFLYWKLDQDQGICTSHKGHVIRMNPFMGVCAVAPESPGQISTHQPGAMGANLDCKEICEGARLYLPVFVEGALFSMGDGHAAQGDGELGCTAIEAPMEEVEVEFKVCDWKQEYPVCRGKDGWITFGFHRDLNKAAYQATREMIKLMQRLYGYEYKEAVAIASLTVDLRITQMVNGVRGVHALLPDQVIRCRESSDCTDNKNLMI